MKKKSKEKIKCSVNMMLKNKIEENNFYEFSPFFQTFDLTIKELKKSINAGFALSYDFGNDPNHNLLDDYDKAKENWDIPKQKEIRKKLNRKTIDNFKSMNTLFLDYDATPEKMDDLISLDNALKNKIFLENACLLHTSFSHHKFDEKNNFLGDRYRIIFHLPFELEKKEAEIFLLGAKDYFPKADNTCFDLARCFFGNTEAQFYFEKDQMMSEELFNEIYENGKKINEIFKKKEYRGIINYVKNEYFIEEIKNALIFINPYDKNSDENYNCIKVKSSLKNFLGNEGEILYNNWVCEYQKIKDITNNRPLLNCSMGTLLYLAKHGGYKPSLKYALEKTKLQPDKIVNIRYIDFEVPDKKVVIIQSNKNTGKTENNKKICRKYSSVLAISHRRTLAGDISERLELQDYRDVKKNENFSNKLSICLDSIVKLNPLQNHFDLIIIDEWTQVFKHLCGDTIKDKRKKVLEILKSYLLHAKKIILTDADFDDNVFDFIINILEENKQFKDNASYFYIKNEHKSVKDNEMIIYNDKYYLIKDLFIELDKRKRVVIASDNKRFVKMIDIFLQENFPDLKIKTVHGENSQEQENKDFIQNLNNEVLMYDILIYSPSISSGVNIHIKHFDLIYGFFLGGSLNHREISQSIARVRQPNESKIKLWICNKNFFLNKNKESSEEILKEYLSFENYLNSTISEFIFFNYNKNKFETTENNFLELQSKLDAFHNKSQAFLKNHFIHYVENEGYEIKYINEKLKDKELIESFKEMNSLINEKAIENIIKADDISKEHYLEYEKRINNLNKKEKNEYYRKRAKLFNGNFEEDLTEIVTLLVKDNDFFNKVKMFGYVFNGDFISDKNILKYESIKKIESSYLGLRELFNCNDITIKQLTGFVNYCTENKNEMKILKISVKKDIQKNPIPTFHSYIKNFGLSLSSKKNGRKVKKSRRYFIDKTKFELIQRIIKRRETNEIDEENAA